MSSARARPPGKGISTAWSIASTMSACTAEVRYGSTSGLRPSRNTAVFATSSSRIFTFLYLCVVVLRTGQWPSCHGRDLPTRLRPQPQRQVGQVSLAEALSDVLHPGALPISQHSSRQRNRMIKQLLDSTTARTAQCISQAFTGPLAQRYRVGIFFAIHNRHPFFSHIQAVASGRRLKGFLPASVEAWRTVTQATAIFELTHSCHYFIDVAVKTCLQALSMSFTALFMRTCTKLGMRAVAPNKNSRCKRWFFARCGTR